MVTEGAKAVSVVLPAYNEEENIERTVAQCAAYLPTRFGDYEIIVVDDGSTDATARLVEAMVPSTPGLRLVSHPVNRGYGSALRTGFDAAAKDWIFLMDSDGQFDITDMDRLVGHTADYDVVIGYRERRADTFVRTLNAWMYRQFIRLAFGLKVRDIDCAFKLFTREAYERVRPIRSEGALFSAELLIKLTRAGYELKEVGVRHFPRRWGQQTGADLRVIVRTFAECWKFRNELRR